MVDRPDPYRSAGCDTQHGKGDRFIPVGEDPERFFL
jgi:hypothetical protein